MIPSSTLLARVLRCALLLLTLSTAAFAAPVNFDIPAQPAPAALDLFIKQSGAQVVYLLADVKDVKANAVKGAYEPSAALDLVLKDTGLSFTERKPGQFSVGRIAPKTASIKGSLLGEGGKPLAGVLVAIRGTGLSASTDSDGEYLFPEVDAGNYILVATAPGYQPLHIVDVNVKAGRDLTLGNEEMKKPLGNVTLLEPIIVKADATTELEKIEVTGTKEKPFQGASMDLPRTINDTQAYYIFDSKTLDQSGATSVEDFLKRRLTMNATGLTNGQISGANPLGNLSSVNLRGLGADKTLILVNGRRMASVTVGTANYQPDINGIPMSAIDRIEVLPSSASGIYGGSAIGGVVNIILKKDYVGGEIRATYDNTFNTDAPARTLSANYGMALEGGKTHITLNATWSDAQPYLVQDRRGIYEKNLATMRQNAPTTSRVPFSGALPNITNDDFIRINGVLTPDNLTLKPEFGGATLTSGITHVAAGTSPTDSTAAVGAGLAAGAGSWNTDLPATTQGPTGLFREVGATPESKAFQASVNRQMLPKLELFADFSYNENRSKSVYNPFGAVTYTVEPDSPISPFTSEVDISIPNATRVPITTKSESRTFTVGAIAQLPWSWTGELDYTRSENRFDSLSYNSDDDAIYNDIEAGAFNPFVDALHYPVNMAKYLTPHSFSARSTLDDLALRGSGPLWALPWGAPNLTVGLEHRKEKTPENQDSSLYAISTDDSTIVTYYPRQSVTDSIYGELTVPLVKQGSLPWVHVLELQFSGRSERYKVDAGTSYYYYYPNAGFGFYGGPTLNGQPYSSTATYTSTNGTTGLKFQPVPELTLRASYATAFLPPSPSQLVINPQLDPYPSTINDPKTGNFVSVRTLSGGNPNLKPQSSKSFTAGVIWEPSARALKGLRFDAEYYQIEQDDAIGSLSAQTIVNLESTYPDRVTRDGTGKITQVNTSMMNLYLRKTEGWDLSADYTFKTGIGTFNLRGVETIIVHLKNQYALTLPESDAVNFPSEGGAVKYKSNGTLTWDWRNWTAAWTAYYYSSYKQYGAIGGPDSTQSHAGAQDPTYIKAQGSDTIPSQTYHDFFLSYTFGKRARDGSGLHAVASSLLSDLTLQVGVRNVFNKIPPYDYYYGGTFYESPFGDLRLRTYWLSLKKAF